MDKSNMITSLQTPKPKDCVNKYRCKFIVIVVAVGLVCLNLTMQGAFLKISAPSGNQQDEAFVVSLELDKVCPASTTINTQNHHLPPSELMPLHEIRSVLRYWHEFNCPFKTSCRFESIGHHLLHHAIVRNQTLLTVQIGAMDGKSNDPMYSMFVRKRIKHVRGREKGGGNNHSFPDLRNWLPVLIEPVPSNYEAMKETYTEIAMTKGLACAVPIHAAVSYDANHQETTSTCPFCRVNTAEDANQTCKELPDWMKFQIGTLDCNHSKRFFNVNFDLCVLQDPLPCSSLTNLLSAKSVPVQNIAMLQIDIEGYEYILLKGFLKEVLDHFLPPIVHFEHKVMKARDIRTPLVHSNSTNNRTRMTIVTELLEAKGYVLYDQGEDYLAIRLHESSSAETEA